MGTDPVGTLAIADLRFLARIGQQCVGLPSFVLEMARIVVALLACEASTKGAFRFVDDYFLVVG